MQQASNALTHVHLINKNILALLVALHVGAILFYLLYKKENLIFPMFSGKKKWYRPEKPATGRTWLAALITAAAGLIIYQSLY